MKKNKGFTLIELLAVILILGIIALVAIPIISKTINTARKSSFKTSVVNSFKTLDYALYKRESNSIPNEGIDISELNLKSDFTGGKFKTIDGKETAFYIRNKSFCAYGSIKDLLITETCEDMDLTSPSIDDSKFVLSSDNSGITISLLDEISKDPDSGIDKYVINLYEGDKLIKTQEKKNIGETKFSDLKSAIVYTVELLVYNGAGGITKSYKNIKSGISDVPTFNVTNNDTWSINKTVTINYDNNKFNCEYSIDGATTWNSYSKPFEITSNVTVNARLIDKELLTNKGNSANKVITKIDDIVPIVTLSKSGKVITYTLTDNELGVVAYCIKTTSGSNDCSWTSITKTSSITKTYTVPTIGTYYIYAKDENNNISDTKSITMSNSDVCTIGQTWNFSYTGSYQSFTVPCNAKYKLEVWGAQGGYRSDSSKPGNGGYSYGSLSISSGNKLYAYVGSSGNNGGWNGGGASAYSSSILGGGGTDFRINSTSLYARVIVAGGGGSVGGSAYGGGHGGGTSGTTSNGGCGTGGGGGGSTSGGAGYSSAASGSFGQGGYGAYANSGYGGGGGGGWYGGGGTYPDGSADDDKGGGGGSGYVYTSSTYSQYPSGCLLNSNYYLTNAATQSSSQTGNGVAKITIESFN